MLKVSATVIGKAAVDRKLLLAKPRILAHNRALVKAMLEYARPIVSANTPLGPAHFGYHGRDTVKVAVYSKGVRTFGELRAAVQLYWREKGTKRGERAFRTAAKAVALTRRFIYAWYGGKAAWWRYP